MTPANSSAGGISTSQMVETRRDNNEEVPVESKSHGYALRSRSQLDLKDHIGFQCPVCPKTFDSLRGLRIHQRKCGRNSSSASDAPAMESSLLAAHQSSDGPVQHHNAVMWGYALTHGETKRPSALNDLKLRPRLKLPNSTDRRTGTALMKRSIHELSLHSATRNGEGGELLTFCRGSRILSTNQLLQSLERLTLKLKRTRLKVSTKDNQGCFASSKLLRKLQGRNSDESREMVATSVKRMHTS